MMDHIKLVIIDGNGWWCFCSLSQDVSPFQADGKPKGLTGLRETVYQ